MDFQKDKGISKIRNIFENLIFLISSKKKCIKNLIIILFCFFIYTINAQTNQVLKNPSALTGTKASQFKIDNNDFFNLTKSNEQNLTGKNSGKNYLRFRYNNESNETDEITDKIKKQDEIVYFAFNILIGLGIDTYYEDIKNYSYDYYIPVFNDKVNYKDKNYLIFNLQTLFFRPVFQFWKFHLGFDFKLRFCYEITDPFFRQEDWASNDSLETFYIYLDKLDFFRFNQIDKDYYFYFGNIENFNPNYGFVIDHFFNTLFVPQFRQLGFYGHMDTSEFNIPHLKIKGFINDIADFDIGHLELSLTPFSQFTQPLLANWKMYTYMTFDLDPLESNRYSASTYEDVKPIREYDYREDPQNISVTFYSLGQEINFFQSSWIFFKLVQEFNTLNFNSFALFMGPQFGFIDLKDHGYIISFEFFKGFSSPYYLPFYFTSLYEINRNHYWQNLYRLSNWNFHWKTVLGFHFYRNRVNFNIGLKKTMTESFLDIFIEAELKNTLLPALSFYFFMEKQQLSYYNFLTTNESGQKHDAYELWTRQFLVKGGFHLYIKRIHIALYLQMLRPKPLDWIQRSMIVEISVRI